MTNNPIALSWSRINVYRGCPAQFKSMYIDKDYPDEGENPAFVKGNRIHKQLEEYVLWKRGEGKEPKLCNEAANAVGIIDNYVEKAGAESVNPEKQIAVTHDWELCDWFERPDKLRFRAIMDMIVFISLEEIHIIDWKSGKFRPYASGIGQLHLSANILFALYPKVQKIVNAYLFVEHKKTEKVTFLREDHAKIRAKFDLEYTVINEDKEFEPKKNSYCFFCAIKEGCKYG